MIKGFLDIIRKENPLQQAQQEAFEMLMTCSAMFDEAVCRLRNSEMANEDYDIRAEDKAVNKLERDIRRKIVSHLTVGHVEHIDTGLALSSTIIDMERLGDYTKNVYDLSRRYQGDLVAGEYESQLRDVEETVRKSFKEIVPALNNSEIDHAREIMQRCTEASKLCNTIVDDIIMGKAPEFESQQVTATVILYFRYLKRISAHLLNIASSVVNPFARIGFKEKDESI
jgi:phosphate transport system protein